MKTNVTNARGSVRSHSGFSVVELMTVIAILAIIAGFATPSFMAIVNNNRLAAVSNDLTATLQSARLEATRRGVQVHVCPSNNGTTCANTDRWRGWIAFADADDDETPDAGEIIRAVELGEGMQLIAGDALADSGRIVFRHDGFAYDATEANLMAASIRACIPTAYPPENARDLDIRTGGRVSVGRTNGGGACNAPADP